VAAASASGIRLIAGLGNPGTRYQATRHNAGFWFADALAHQQGVPFKASTRYHGAVCELPAEQACVLLKPDTFMNRSGLAVAALAGFYKISAAQILVVHDELDLPPGTVRLKRGGGHGGHNGLRSLIESLGTNAFLRLRLGIGHPGHRDLVTDYVLSKPSPEDRAAIEDAIKASLAVIQQLLEGEVERAIHELHTLKPNGAS